MLGDIFNEILKFQNGITSPLYHCKEIAKAIQCLSSTRTLDPKESCGPIFQIGDCFPETSVGGEHAFPCMANSDYGDTVTFTKRRCSSDGHWSDLNDVNEPYFFDCTQGWLNQTETNYDYYASSESSEYDDSMSNSTFEDVIPDEMPTNNYMSITISLAIVSFLFSLVSFILMAVLIRKCTRIYIHMNLLAAIMLRHLTFIVFILYKVIQWRIKVEPKLEDIQKSLIELSQNQYIGWDSYLQPLESYELNDLTSVEQSTCSSLAQFEVCKCQLQCLLYPVIQKYSVLVCFSWLACEGIYLVMLHLKPLLLIQKFNPMKWFLWLSWGLPIIPVGLWATLAPYNCINGYSYDRDDSYRRITEIPIYIYIIICATIFVVIIYGIFQKLNAPHHGSGRSRVFGVLKAAVSLVPLLGMQQALLPFTGALSEETQKKLGPICIILSQCSGIIVSILYCFISAEIREAIGRRWRQHKELKEIYNEISTRRQSRDSSSESSSKITQIFSRFRRRSEASTFSILRQPSSEPNVVRVEECESESIDQAVPLFDPYFKRPSTCSKHSEYSNGYYSGLSENSESAVNTITDTMIISRAPLLEINETSFDESQSSPNTVMTDIPTTLHNSTPESVKNAPEIPAVIKAPAPEDNNEDQPKV